MVDKIIGNSFLQQEKTVDSSVFSDIELVGIYFSAHWCPPCRSFTPILAQGFYEEINKDRKRIEIIFVTADKSDKEFKDYYSSMPWLAIPHGDARIKSLFEKLQVNGIPTLVILDKDGNIKSQDARSEVLASGAAAYEKWLK